jgi:hypothetical protein
MEQGEESVETPDQVPVQTAVVSQSDEEQVGTSWGHTKLSGDVYDSVHFRAMSEINSMWCGMMSNF